MNARGIRPAPHNRPAPVLAGMGGGGGGGGRGKGYLFWPGRGGRVPLSWLGEGGLLSCLEVREACGGEGAQASVPVMLNSVSLKSFSFPYKGLLLELHIFWDDFWLD